MVGFRFQECKFVWNRENKIPRRDKYAIRKEVKFLSEEIGEAVNYTKELAKKRFTEVRLWLNTHKDPTYLLSIWYDSVANAWNISIHSVNDERFIGEIDCKSLPTFSLV